MAYDNKSREAFVESVVRFLVQYNFDGLDFDWEYPTQRGGIPEDRANFVETLALLKNKLKVWNLLLTIAVPFSTAISDSAYNVTEIEKYVNDS